MTENMRKIAQQNTIMQQLLMLTHGQARYQVLQYETFHQKDDTGAYQHEETRKSSPIERKVCMDVSSSYAPTRSGGNLPQEARNLHRNMHKNRNNRGLSVFLTGSDLHSIEIGPNNHNPLQGSKNMTKSKSFERFDHLEKGEKEGM